MFPSTADINLINSTHVESVVKLVRKKRYLWDYLTSNEKVEEILEQYDDVFYENEEDIHHLLEAHAEKSSYI